MKTVKAKPQKGLLIFLIIVAACLALFILSFVLVGVAIGQSHNPQIKDFGALIQYHVNGFKGLFTFSFNDASNVLYFDFSCLLYVAIGLWVIFIGVGIFSAIKRKRATIVFGLVATLLAIFVFMFTATGVPQYWLIVNQRYPYDNNNMFLLIFTFLTILFSGLYILLANALYFVCVIDTYKNSKVIEEQPVEVPVEEKKEAVIESSEKEESAPILEEPKEEQVYEYDEEKDDSISKKDLAELIRDIVREEVSKHAPNNPYPQGPLVVQYFGTAPAQQNFEQPKPEQKPLPKEEPKQEPVAEVAPSDEVVVHENIVPEEEKAPEYIIVPEEEKKEEPVKEESKPEVVLEKKPIIRIPFYERMINADDEMKKN